MCISLGNVSRMISSRLVLYWHIIQHMTCLVPLAWGLALSCPHSCVLYMPRPINIKSNIPRSPLLPVLLAKQNRLTALTFSPRCSSSAPSPLPPLLTPGSRKSKPETIQIKPSRRTVESLGFFLLFFLPAPFAVAVVLHSCPWCCISAPVDKTWGVAERGREGVTGR